MLERALAHLPIQIVLFQTNNNNKEQQRYLHLQQLISEETDEESFEATECDIDDTAVVFFSSGTTGLPKGVCASHYGLISQQRYLMLGHDMSVLLYFTSFYWISAVMMLIVGVLSGSTRVLVRLFDPARAIDAIERYRVSMCFLSPTYMYRILVDEPALVGRDTRCLSSMLVGGDVVVSDRLQQFRRALPHTRTHVIYGMTEACGLLSSFHPLDDEDFALNKPTSVGLPIPTISYKVSLLSFSLKTTFFFSSE